jgi:hypothetical protein
LKDSEGERIGRILSPLINVFLQHHIDFVSYFGDYHTERLVHSITVVLHVVQIHISISIYYSVVYHMRIRDKDLSGSRPRSYYDVI